MVDDSRRQASQLHYLRHFALLALAAGALSTPWAASGLRTLRGELTGRELTGYDLEFALYGFLHALTVAVSLREARSLPRRLAFVAGAAFLDLAVWHLILVLQHAAAGLRLSVLLPAGLGAAAYALLARCLVRFELRFVVLAPVACVLGLCSAIGVARIAPGPAWVVGWWFAFSTWLYGADRGSARHSHA